MTFLEELQAQTGLLGSQIRQSSPFATYKPTSERTVQGVPQNYFDPATNQFMMPEMTGMGGTMSGVGTGFGTGFGSGFGTYTPGAFGQFYGNPVGTGGSFISPSTGVTGSTVGGGGGGRPSSPNPTAYNFPNQNVLPGTLGMLGLLANQPLGTQFSWNEQTQSYQPTAFVNVPEDVTSYNIDQSTMSMDRAGNVTYGSDPYGIGDFTPSAESQGSVDHHHPGRPNPATSVTGLGMLGPGFMETTTPQDVGAVSSDVFSGMLGHTNLGPQAIATGQDRGPQTGPGGTSGTGYGAPGNFGAANAAAQAMGFAGAVGQTDPNTGVVSAVTNNGIPVGYGERGDNGGGQGFGGDTGVGQDAGTMGGTGGRRGGAGQNGGNGGGGGSGFGGGGAPCFVKGTPVQMLDGTTKPIEQIEVGDLTKGGEVWMTIVGIPQEIYNYLDVEVSAHHWVKENNQWIEVYESKHAIKTDKVETVYNLNTSDNTIWIKDIEFSDYMQVPDSEWEPYYQIIKEKLNKELND